MDNLYGALVKKHDLDSLLEKAERYTQSPDDKAFTEMARQRSRKLADEITDGVDRGIPERMAKFMRPRTVV